MAHLVKFFKTVHSSDGHAFKALQRVITVTQATSSTHAAEAAKRAFERLEMVPQWHLHADCCEVELAHEGSRR